MAAGIEKRDSQTGIEMAWHGKTNVVETITKQNAGILYPMEKRVLPSPFGGETPFYAVFSMDDKLPIGDTIGKDYKLVTNEQMFDMVEQALGGTNHKIVSIGTVNDRSKAFCSIRLSENIIAGNRETENVLNVLWGHGGKFSILARSGFTVVVCANTFAMALARKGEFELRMKHTGNSELKLENMAKAIDGHYGVVSEFKKAMDSFAAQHVTEKTAEQIFAGFLVRKVEEDTEVSTRTGNTIDRLNQLFRSGAGNKGQNMCDIFNAFTDYYSHESSGGENRYKQFESSEFGAGHKRKTEAFGLLRGANVKDLGTLDEVIARGAKVLQLC